MSSLERYREKRDFSRTKEPAPGKGHRRSSATIYTVQKHDASRLHYDLRLEHNGVLKSWAITRGPSVDPSDKRLAVETEDHPLDYATFEGTIPKGEYGGGTVMLWDRGTWAMADGKDADEGLAKGALTFDIFGERLAGRWHLQRMKDEANRPPQWLLIKVRDDAAHGPQPVKRYTKSVATGRTMAAIATQEAPDPPPHFVAPMLCRTRATPPQGEGWLAEVKYDGYRMALRAADDGVTLTSRNKKDYTHRFVGIAKAAEPLRATGVLFDGEVVVFDDEGRTDFGALADADKSGKRVSATYVAFDCLHLSGEDLRDKPIEERKAALKAHVPGGAIIYGDHVSGQQAALFEKARALGLEGIIVKRAGSAYRSGRHDAWAKVRAVKETAVAVGGFTRRDDGGLGALLVGGWSGDDLVPLGRVGTGFNARSERALLDRLSKRTTQGSPFKDKVDAKGATFVAPKIAVTVEYLAVTRDGRLRHPAYKGLASEGRPGLPPDLVSGGREESGAAMTAKRVASKPKAPPTNAATKADAPASVHGVNLSSPDKVLFPEVGLTKAELAAHWDTVMDRALPHLAGRPLTLVRCPQGRAKSCFYQRHPEGMPERMARDIGEDDLAIVANEPADLMELVQRGTLEVHIRGVRADKPDRPDRVVFDLDPGEGVDTDDVIAAALTVRERLDGFGLRSFPMLTGGKGVHVVLPVERRTPYDEVKAWARAVARSLADDAPDRFVVNMAKAKRKGRIFIDYLRNDHTSSAIAPYSPRARSGAPAAKPVTWDILPMLKPDAYHAGEPLPDEDPWVDMNNVRQRLGKAQHEGLVRFMR